MSTDRFEESALSRPLTDAEAAESVQIEAQAARERYQTEREEAIGRYMIDNLSAVIVRAFESVGRLSDGHCVDDIDDMSVLIRALKAVELEAKDNPKILLDRILQRQAGGK